MSESPWGLRATPRSKTLTDETFPLADSNLLDTMCFSKNCESLNELICRSIQRFMENKHMTVLVPIVMRF